MDTLGRRLRLARERKRLSQVDVYKRTGINNKTLSRYENDGTEPDADSLRRLAELYEVSVDYLLGIEIPGGTRDYDPFLRAIKEKYPGVNIDDPEIQKKLMKVVDLVLEDYQQKRQQ